MEHKTSRFGISPTLSDLCYLSTLQHPNIEILRHPSSDVHFEKLNNVVMKISCLQLL